MQARASLLAFRRSLEFSRLWLKSCRRSGSTSAGVPVTITPTERHGATTDRALPRTPPPDWVSPPENSPTLSADQLLVDAVVPETKDQVLTQQDSDQSNPTGCRCLAVPATKKTRSCKSVRPCFPQVWVPKIRRLHEYSSACCNDTVQECYAASCIMSGHDMPPFKPYCSYP